MQPSGSMAILATDGKFAEWRIIIEAIAPRNGLWLATVANDALFQDRPAETQVVGLVTWREPPGFGVGVERQRCLKEVISLSNNVSSPLRTCPDNVSDSFGLPKEFLLLRIQGVLTLVDFGSLTKNLKVPIPGLIENGDWIPQALQRRGFICRRHRTAHRRLAIVLIDFDVTTRATLGARVGNFG